MIKRAATVAPAAHAQRPHAVSWCPSVSWAALFIAIAATSDTTYRLNAVADVPKAVSKRIYPPSAVNKEMLGGLPWRFPVVARRVPAEEEWLERKQMSTDAVQVVARTEFVHVPYVGGEAQKIELEHCLQFIQCDAFYGEFELLDSYERVLGTSVKGRLSLLRKDLTTDVARVWFDAISRSSAEFKHLQDDHKVADPGLDVGGLKPLQVLFLNAPKAPARINHIPMYYRSTCVWDAQTMAFLD